MTREQRIQKERIRLIVGAVLTVIAPPIGIFLIVWDMIDDRKKKKAKKTESLQLAPKKVSVIRWKGQEEKPHGHTPVQYSYDSCAATHRLEQLTVLYKAGLYTKEQYREARTKLLEKS